MYTKSKRMVIENFSCIEETTNISKCFDGKIFGSLLIDWKIGLGSIIKMTFGKKYFQEFLN